MDRCLEITLPWPPSVNKYWRAQVINGKPRNIISAKGRAYRKSVIRCAKFLTKRMRGRLSVELQAYPPDRLRRDLDNLPKGLLDGLTHAGVWGDDNQVDELTIKRMPVKKPGRVVVRIREISD